MYIHDLAVTQDCLWAALDDFPKLQHHGHRQLFGYLVLSGYHDKTIRETEGVYSVPLPHELIKLIYKTGPRTSAEKLIAWFSKDIFPLQIREHNRVLHQCRRVDLPDLAMKYQQLNLKPVESEFHLMSLMTRNFWRPRRTEVVHQEALRVAQDMLVNHALEAEAAYLHALNAHHFIPAAANVAHAETQIEQLANPAAKEGARYQLEQIRRLNVSKPVYFPVANSQRIFSGSPQHLLPKEIRRALYPDYVELDLECVQLAAMATFLGATQAAAYIAEIGSPWLDISRATGVSAAGVKNITYPFAYGAGIKRIRSESGLTDKEIKAVLKHPLFADLVPRRDAFIKQLEADGYGLDPVSGDKLQLNPVHKHPALSVFAQIMQRMEVALIKPSFEIMPYAKAVADCDIVFFQHDGFSLFVRAKVRQKQIVEMLKLAVQKKAEQLGVPTKLVQKF